MITQVWRALALLLSAGFIMGSPGILYGETATAGANSGEKPTTSLRLLDDPLNPQQLPQTPSARSALGGLAPGAQVRFRVCVDEEGKPYDAKLISAPNPALGSQWLQYINETRFAPPRIIDNETCVAVRVDIELRSLSPERWRMKLWDEKEFDECPLVKVDEAFEAFVISQITVGRPKYSVACTTNMQGEGKTSIVVGLEPLDSSSHWYESIQMKPSEYPLKNGVPMCFSSTGICWNAEERPDKLSSLLVFSLLVGLNYEGVKEIRADFPEYPRSYVENGLIGKCRAKFIVDEQGNVTNAAIESSTLKGFAEATLKALEKHKYKPAEIDGKKVPTLVRRDFVFSLSRGGNHTTGYRVTQPSKEYLKIFPKYDTPSEVLNVEDVVYPLPSLIMKKTGIVKVVGIIDTNGIPTQIQISKSANPEMDNAAMAAFSRFRFKAAMTGKEPVVSSVTWTFDFDGSDLFDTEREILQQLRKDKLQITPANELDKTIKPLIRQQPEPIRIANFTGKGGRAVITVIVDEKGYVRLPEITESTDPVYGYNAAASVAKWWFSIPKKNGKPVKTKVRIPFEYK